MTQGADAGRATGVRALAWTGAEALINVVAQITGAFVVARIIGAEEVGVGALVVSAFTVLITFLSSLGQNALVQMSELADDTVAAYLGFVSLVSVGGAVVLCLASPLLRLLIDDPRYAMMCVALALPVLASGQTGVLQGVCSRRRMYRAMAVSAFVAQIVGVIAAVLVAEAGLGAWALIAQQALSAVAALVVLVPASRLPFRLSLRFSRCRPILRVSIPLALGATVTTVRYRLFMLIIGGRLGAAALGQTHIAFRLAETVRELISNAVYRIQIPGFGERRADAVSTRAYYAGGTLLVASAGCLVMSALYLSLPLLVRSLLGPEWLEGVPASRILAALGAASLAVVPAASIQVAHGRTQTLFASAALSLAVLLALDAAVAPHTPTAAAVLWSVASLPLLSVSVWEAARILGSAWTASSPALAPTAIATVAVGLVSVAQRWVGIDAARWGPGIGSVAASCALILAASALWKRGALVEAVRALRQSR